MRRAPGLPYEYQITRTSGWVRATMAPDSTVARRLTEAAEWVDPETDIAYRRATQGEQ